MDVTLINVPKGTMSLVTNLGFQAPKLPAEMEKLLKDQLANEERIAKLYEKTVLSALPKRLLEALAMDSRKHAFILRTVLDLEKGQRLTKSETERSIKELRKHADTEKRFIDQYDGLLKKTNIQTMATILRYIYDDEVRHHKLILSFVDALEVGERQLEEISYEYLLTWTNPEAG